MKIFDSICEKAEQYYYDYITKQAERRIPDDIIGHIKNCAICQEKIAGLKTSLLAAKNTSRAGKNALTAVNVMLELHFAYIGKPIDCSTVKPLLPCMLDSDLAITIPTPITVHIDHCPQCRQDLKTIAGLNLNRDGLLLLSKLLAGKTADDAELGQTARKIMTRLESGVITVFNVAEPAASGEKNNLYAGFPVKVDVLGGETVKQPQTVKIDFAHTFKQRISAITHTRLFKPGLIAAAVMLFAVALFISQSSAAASTLEQVYKAFDNIKNIYIATFAPDKTQPAQELWVSKTLSVYITKTQNQLILWDTNAQTQKIKDLLAGTVQMMPITRETLANINDKMSGCFGLMPFQDISSVPLDARWQHVTSTSLNIPADTEAYDLIWNKRASDGSLIPRKWRFFVNKETHLPLRVENYIKLFPDEKYSLEKIYSIKYVSDSEVQAVLTQISF